MGEMRDISLYIPEEGITTGTAVEILGKALCRLEENPFGVESVKYGDVIKVRNIDETPVEFVEIVESSNFVHLSYILTKELIESIVLDQFLEQVMTLSGYWQRDFGGCLSIFCRPEHERQIQQGIQEIFREAAKEN